jgi:TetR/AcrR family transcriptional regulator, regulator of cefoperazone and chloramphenicol sensitivity
MNVQPDDLTAKARIRDAAVGLFSDRGIAETSVRSIAAQAGVSPALAIHHFRSKQGLVDAVDDWVAATIERIVVEAVDRTPTGVGPAEMIEAVPVAVRQAVVTLMIKYPAARDYLGRGLLENRPGSARLLDTVLDLIEAQPDMMEGAGLVRRGTDRVLRAQCVCFVLLGPILLARQLEARLGASPFDPVRLARLANTNEDILRRGLYVRSS